MLRAALTVVLLSTCPAFAQWGYAPSRPLETMDDAWRRQESNRFQQDRAFGGQPLGGYREPMGSPFVPPPQQRQAPPSWQ